MTFPIEGRQRETPNSKPETNSIPLWQRWNDYGIGLFLEGTDKGSEKGQLLQAAEAFEQVEKLGRYDGPLNLARVYFKEGRLDDAVAALQRAAKFDPPAPRWTIAWLNGLVNKQNGYLDKAITEFRSILEDRYEELDKRGFDFSLDYEVINELGQTLFERAKLERGDEATQKQMARRRPSRVSSARWKSIQRKRGGALQPRADLRTPRPTRTRRETSQTPRALSSGRQRPRPRHRHCPPSRRGRGPCGAGDGDLSAATRRCV